LVTGFEPAFYDDVDALLGAAARHGVRVILVLLDYTVALQSRIVSNVQLGGRASVLRDPVIRQSFMDNALAPLLQRYQGHPALFAIEIINEPEWVIEELPERIPNGVDYVPLAAVREFARLAADEVHRHDPLAVVTMGNARRDWTELFSGLGIDVFSAHWYDHFASVEPFPFLPCPPSLGASCFIGEVPTASTLRSATQFRASAQAAGYRGLALWSSRAEDAFSDLGVALSDMYLGDAPGLFPATVTGSHSGKLVTLSWTPSRGEPPATAYLIQASLTSGGPVAAVLQTPPAATSMTGAAPDGVYYVAVRKLTAAGVGPLSNESVVVVGRPPVPTEPRNLTARAAGSTFTLHWDTPANLSVAPPTDYVIEAGRAPALADLARFATGSSNLTFATPPVPNGRYYVRVRARNASGTSAPSNETVVTIGSVAAGPPANLIGSAVGGVVNLAWTAPVTGGAVTGYQLVAGSAAGRSDIARVNLTASMTNVAVPNVPPGVYFVRVLSVDSLGPSAASNEIVLMVP
jgi:hypothetical protein